jgi:3-hydroxyisobutyrate dehydrogenase-like beta-hydroxyacid dehydrogenase
MRQIGLVGAGLMGRGIARNLLKAGYPLVAHKRSLANLDEKTREMRDAGARLTSDLADVFRSCDLLLLCLPSSIEVEEVMLGPRSLAASRDGTVKQVVDFSTARPASTRAIREKLAAQGIGFVDAPMTGGPPQAEQGALNLAVGCRAEEAGDLARLFAAIAKNVVYAGAPAAGNVAKLLNNFLSILDRSAASCVSLLAQDSGVDLAVIKEFISVSGGYSRGFQTEIEAIMADRFPLGFALELALKDLRYASELADSSGRSFALLRELSALLTAATEAGYGRKDLNTVYQHLAAASRRAPA